MVLIFTMEEKNLSERESLQLIQEMIAKAKHSFHENGTSALLWGSVVAICGLISFAQMYWHFYIGFDIWLLTLAALIPQVFISIRQRRQRKVVSHAEATLNVVWMVYTVSIFALVFYINAVSGASDRILASEGVHLVSINAEGKTEPFHYFVPSASSLFLLLYAIPTLATGMTYRFKPMTFGALLCYAFFIVSVFVPSAWDYLLNGLAGIFNWFIPGLILRHRFNREKKRANV